MEARDLASHTSKTNKHVVKNDNFYFTAVLSFLTGEFPTGLPLRIGNEETIGIRTGNQLRF